MIPQLDPQQRPAGTWSSTTAGGASCALIFIEFNEIAARGLRRALGACRWAGARASWGRSLVEPHTLIADLRRFYVVAGHGQPAPPSGIP